MAVVVNPAPPTLANSATQEEVKGRNVFFRYVNGKTFCLWLDPDLSIAKVQQALIQHQRRTGDMPSTLLAFNDVFLIYNGKPLSEDMLLSDYHVSETGVIAVNARVKGGCFMVSLSILTTICLAVVGSPCTCGLSLLIVPVLLPLLFILPLFCL